MRSYRVSALLLRVQVRLPQALVLPRFLSLNRRLGNVHKVPPLPVHRQLPIRRNQRTYQQLISSTPLSLLPEVSASQ